MSSFFESGPLPDWKDIQKWLGKDIPWKLVDQWDGNGDDNWLNQYVEQILRRTKRPAEPSQAQPAVRTEIRQEAKAVLVAIRLRKDAEMSRLRLYATSERLKVTGLPGDKKRTIRFPCLVYANTGKAVMKNKDTLIVRFRRRPPEKSEYELFIQP